MIYSAAHFDSPLGRLRLIANESALCYLLLPGESPNRLALPKAPVERRTAILDLAAAELNEYFDGRRRRFTIPTESGGTAFEKKVWDGLRGIPYGETRHYGALAAALGLPKAARAVGRANSLNPLSIVVPCHRVIGKTGSLVGYAGGLGAKAYLLALEKGDQRR